MLRFKQMNTPIAIRAKKKYLRAIANLKILTFKKETIRINPNRFSRTLQNQYQWMTVWQIYLIALF